MKCLPCPSFHVPVRGNMAIALDNQLEICAIWKRVIGRLCMTVCAWRSEPCEPSDCPRVTNPLGDRRLIDGDTEVRRVTRTKVIIPLYL